MCRQLVAISAAYLGDLITAGTTATLDTPATLTFGRLLFAESRGTERAVELLADCGMSLAEALGRVGVGQSVDLRVAGCSGPPP